MSPFFLGPRIDHLDHAALAHPLRGAGRAPRAAPLIRAAGIREHPPDRAGPHARQARPSQSPPQRAERPGRGPVRPPIWRPLGGGHDPPAGGRVVGRTTPAAGRDAQRRQSPPMEAPTNFATLRSLRKPACRAACANDAPPASASSAVARRTRSARALVALTIRGSVACSAIVSGRSGSCWRVAISFLRPPTVSRIPPRLSTHL